MISVIIPNWNGKGYLSACLMSLRRQTYRDFEVILVDNGSDDGSVELVKVGFPEVRVIRFTRNRGFSAAVNAGIEVSTGEYIALLNSDTETDPHWLQELKSVLDNRNDVGFCASKILYYENREILNSAGDAMSVTGYARCIGNKEKDSERHSGVREVFGASGAAAMYRRTLFGKIGTFDEDYFAYYEDVDLSLRAQLSGFRCLYIPTAVVYHWGGGATKHIDDFDTFFIERNSVFNVVKGIPLAMLRRSIWVIMRAHLGRGFYLMSERKFTTWVRAKLCAAASIDRMLRKRREIQRKSGVSLEYISSLLEDSDRQE